MTAGPPSASPAGPPGPPEDNASALALGLAQHVQRWSVARGAPPAAAQAAARAAQALSLATQNGHVCLWLDDLAGAEQDPGHPADTSAWRQALLASQVVGTPQAPAQQPLILDDDGRLYLHRHFDLESRLARRLLRSSRWAGWPHSAPTPAPTPVQDPQADATTALQLAALFDSAPADAGDAPAPAGPDWQKLAAALALRGRLTVISGGPGTGKTTTVVKLLAALLAREPQARVVLAAPTGKAAARLAEAVRHSAITLAPALRERLPTDASTVHRLLGVRPGRSGGASPDDAPGEGGFEHHAGNLLALDVLVVDEASMLDLALATRLMEAVPDAARIILLGDKDQLAAVETGAVFAELCADPRLSPAAVQHLSVLTGVPAADIQPPAPSRPSVLHDSVVWFQRNHRFAAGSGIARLAADTIAGRADVALGWLRIGPADGSVSWLDDGGPAPATATLAHIAQGYAAYVAACRAGLAGVASHASASNATAADRDCAIATITQAFGRFRVLCAVREGPRGVATLNDGITRLLRPLLTGQAGDFERSPWYAGRPVMVLRNDAAQRLFNGDIGITLPGDDGGLRVYFPAADGGFRPVAPARLPPHQSAWAMTVHKSQGSEFDAVLLLLPAQRSRVLSRELLYTGITRARQHVALAASAAVLMATLQAGSQRQSGLLARLREAAGG